MPEHRLKSEYISNNFLLGLLFLPVLMTSSLALAVNVQAQVRVLDIRSGQHPDKTRVVMEISEKADYRMSYLDHNDDGRSREIIVDLMQASSRDMLRALAPRASGVGLLNKITVEDHEGSVRLRIGLRRPAVIANSFTLNPDHGFQYRLVFDLKAVTIAEWARLVKHTPPPPVPEPVIAPPTKRQEVVREATEEIIEEAPESPEFPESYDDMMMGDSNFTLSGYVEMEGRVFPQTSFSPGSRDWTVSFALEPLLEYVSDSGNSQIMFRPFGRADVNDSGRSHFDIRELKWTGIYDRWQVTLGIDTLFWGVTESSHLVDIINQDDNLEDIDQEDKLGQPLASLSFDSDFGLFSAYVMTYFRELRFPGRKGRLAPPLPVDISQTQYEAGSGKWNTDWAVRWSHVMGNFDVGLYHFRGTNRESEFLPGTGRGGNAVLIPRYNLINQTGLDLQGTFEDFLIKFEAIRRTGNGLVTDQNFWAMAGGIEYSFYGIGGGDSDIGLLVEYLYDDRGSLATTPFEDDVFAGMRWAANDIDSTQILLGAIFDLDSSAKFVNFEGSRRIGDNWKITLDARFFLGVPMTDPLFVLSRDDFFQLRLARYF